jgi:ABC-type Fe2+-enterobactin transport system substrate-binding protein
MATQKKEPIKKVEEEKSDDAKLVEEIREVVQAKEVKEEKSEIDLLKERLAQLEQSNAMLLEISDNKSKAFFYDKNQEKLPTNMNVRSYGGKIIIG